MREIFRREIRREKVCQNGPLYTTNKLGCINILKPGSLNLESKRIV